MKPKDEEFNLKRLSKELFREALEDMLDMSHPLVSLAFKFNWKKFEEKFGLLFPSKTGKPATPTRLIVGLLYLKHTYNHSDDEVIARFRENPYWQFFCGYPHFEIKSPCDPTVLTRWRQKMGEHGLEELLQETLAVAFSENLLKPSELNDVVVDTTVQEKNISFPTDAKLLNRAREHLVKEAKKRGFVLRQTYTKEGKIQLVKYHGYTHAKQFKRARKPLKRLRTILGRVFRELQRIITHPDESLKAKLQLAFRILNQKKNSKDKVYSFHEPKVECISKGKAHKRYEFGCKVSITTTNKSCWIIGAKAFHGRPYDGHTLFSALEQSKKVVGRYPLEVFVDKGYRGNDPPDGVQVFLSGQKRKITPRRRKLLRRRSSIEPVIGHLKRGYRLGRNFLKGIEGDKNNVVLAAAGFNMAKLIAAFLYPIFIEQIFSNFLI